MMPRSQLRLFSEAAAPDPKINLDKDVVSVAGYREGNSDRLMTFRFS